MPQLTETAIAAAFAPHRDEMKKSFINFMSMQLARLTRRYGKTIGELRRAGNSPDYGAYHQIRSFLDHKGSNMPREINGFEAEFDMARLDKAAERYVQDTVDSLVAKVLSKVGDLEDVQLSFASSSRFVLRGKRCGDKVTIRQDCILNVSKLGKLYNQWPARIELNGKRISAKAYSELTA